MCSKRRTFRIAVFLAAVLPWGWLQPAAGETLDCLLARVDNQPVTLLDVKVLDAFGLFEPAAAPTRRAVLDRWVELLIVIELVRERVSISPERVLAAREAALSRLEPGRAETLLRSFGLEADDLLAYFEQKLVYQEIISMRFGRSTIVTLKEIESYYQTSYVSDARKRGEEPLPILEVLDELEAFLKAEKIKGQAEAWIRNLKRQADVRFMTECLSALDRE